MKELGTIALPPRLRRTALYRTSVEITARFLIQEMGQVENVYPKEERLAENFLLRRGASHGIELLGLLTFHLSPIWVLAALADAAGAGSELIGQISQALKDEGLLDREKTFETVDQLLDGLERSSAHLAGTLNAPPLNIAGLRREWEQLKTELPTIPRAKLPSNVTLSKIWQDLVDSAKSQNRSVFAVCSAVALSTWTNLPAKFLWLSRVAQIAGKRTGSVLGEALLDHYKISALEISHAGFLPFWRTQFRPYLRAAAQQFAARKTSTTEYWIARRSRKPRSEKIEKT